MILAGYDFLVAPRSNPWLPHLQVVHEQNHVTLGEKGQGEFVGYPPRVKILRYGKSATVSLCKSANFPGWCQVATGAPGVNHQGYKPLRLVLGDWYLDGWPSQISWLSGS